MIKSSTALRMGINNYPPEFAIVSLKLLAINVLEPVRLHFKKPVFITSGYRCKTLNASIGSKPTSQHTKGEAADFEIPGISNAEIAKWIQDNLDFDQLILEFYFSGQPSSGWVHVSYKEKGNRNNVLTINSNGVYDRLLT